MLRQYRSSLHGKWPKEYRKQKWARSRAAAPPTPESVQQAPQSQCRTLVKINTHFTDRHTHTHTHRLRALSSYYLEESWFHSCQWCRRDRWSIWSSGFSPKDTIQCERSQSVLQINFLKHITRADPSRPAPVEVRKEAAAAKQRELKRIISSLTHALYGILCNVCRFM